MDISGALTETVTRRAVSVRSNSGDPTFGSPSTFSARIERTSGVAYSSEGAAISFRQRLFTTTSVALSDALWFPEDDSNNASAARRPIEVSVLRDLAGNVSHYEVLL